MNAPINESSALSTSTEGPVEPEAPIARRPASSQLRPGLDGHLNRPWLELTLVDTTPIRESLLGLG